MSDEESCESFQTEHEVSQSQTCREAGTESHEATKVEICDGKFDKRLNLPFLAGRVASLIMRVLI